VSNTTGQLQRIVVVAVLFLLLFLLLLFLLLLFLILVLVLLLLARVVRAAAACLEVHLAPSTVVTVKAQRTELFFECRDLRAQPREAGFLTCSCIVVHGSNLRAVDPAAARRGQGGSEQAAGSAAAKGWVAPRRAAGGLRGGCSRWVGCRKGYSNCLLAGGRALEAHLSILPGGSAARGADAAL
jgi:hypothetical protein